MQETALQRLYSAGDVETSNLFALTKTGSGLIIDPLHIS